MSSVCVLLIPSHLPLDVLAPLASQQVPVVWKVREGPVGRRWRAALPEHWFDPIASLCALSTLTGEAAVVLGQRPFGWAVDVAARGEHTAGWGRPPRPGDVAAALNIDRSLLRRGRLRVAARARALLDALDLEGCPLTFKDADPSTEQRFRVLFSPE